MATQKKGGGSRKLGRNKPWCLIYKNTNKRAINKRKIAERHIARFPNDIQAQNALRSWTDKMRFA